MVAGVNGAASTDRDFGFDDEEDDQQDAHYGVVGHIFGPQDRCRAIEPAAIAAVSSHCYLSDLILHRQCALIVQDLADALLFLGRELALIG